MQEFSQRLLDRKAAPVQIALVILAIVLGNLGSELRIPSLAWVASACVVGALASLMVSVWCGRRGGVADLIHGGGAWYRTSLDRVSWFDWSILVTRSGMVNADAGLICLRRSVFFGLIPREERERPLEEIARAETKERQPESESVTVVTHEVILIDKDGQSQVVLDLAVSTETAGGFAAQRLIHGLAAELNKLIGPDAADDAQSPA